MSRADMAEMTLGTLVDTATLALPDLDLRLSGRRATVITGLALDSRLVEEGALFVCIRGADFDGHAFARDAVDAGARSVLVDHPLDLPREVSQIVSADTRSSVGWLAAAFHGFPSRGLSVVGITGTNGKTTSVHLLTEILRANDRSVASIGTLSGLHTTPESTELQARLAAEVEAGTSTVVMEVSSHALAQHRVDGTWFEIAAFTNLSLDHLDFHTTFEEYFEAKASLFRPDRTEMSVIDVGSPMGRRLADLVATEVIEVDLDEVDDLTVTPTGSSFRLDGHQFSVPLAGRFNVSNALVAIRCAQQLGLPTAGIADGLAAASPVPGRVERIDEGQDFTVLVDYAHTPDGLSKVLSAARELSTGRVLVVFGCGGDRDHSKRPEMGYVASDLADVVVVTSDNPRSEDPGAIIEEIASGIPADMVEPTLEADRRRAIGLALGQALSGDFVVIAGKGHEQTQTIGSRVEPFDDRVVARQVLTERRTRS
jgi:UDP-N-acetylmuramoyl-L-alanyl-D-glutamate--2,6-diaminopimelate ligase